jgi:hypothetical protein
MTETRAERTEWLSLPATALHSRLGDLPLGSLQSRAATRSLIAARKACEEDGLRFQVVSIVDGKPVNLGGLAEQMGEARVRR